MKLRLVTAALTVPLACGFTSTPASCGSLANIFPGGPSPVTVVEFDPSACSIAMGGASGAVFWGDSPNHWANPALLGLVSGLHYDDGTTVFLPEDELVFRAHQSALGYGGLGLASAGRPFKSLGKLEEDLQGLLINDVPSPPLFERVRTWGVGASLSGLLSSATGLMHRDAPGFTRYADLAFGYAGKEVEQGFVTDNGAGETIRGHDWGLLARTGLTKPSGGGRAIPQRIEVAYGFSVQNAGNDRANGFLALRSHYLNAFALRTTLGMPGTWRRGLPAWLAPALDPLLSLGLAFDTEHATIGTSSNFDSDRRHYGAELTVANVASVRFGHITSAGGPPDDTWGFGIGILLGRIAGARYARAVTPPAVDSGLPDIPHTSWSLWLDPIALGRAIQERVAKRP